jgi:hypothetical protein
VSDPTPTNCATRPGAITLTAPICRAAGHDVATKRMRAQGRKVWNDDDWNAAAERTARLMVLSGAWPVELYQMHTGQPFVTKASA